MDPLNRLVARELERRWNDKLQEVNEVRERIEKEKRQLPKPTSEEIKTIHSLSRRLPEVWRHPETDPAVKKKIIRMVVEEVLMDLNDETLMLTMTIHWRGLRVDNKIAPFDRKKKTDVVSLNEAAKRLGVNTYVVRQLIRKGIMEAKQIIAYAPFEIESSGA